MNKLEWNETLSIGSDLIDNQHKQWIKHYNQTAEAVANQQEIMQISKTLGFLIDYTETHFTTEERNMAAHHYHGIDDHKAQHNELRRTLADLIRDFEEEGVTHALADAIDTFLGNWLIKHIQEVDTKFGVFITEKGIILSE
jgi:hemerythrin